jgi:hypothetical protein
VELVSEANGYVWGGPARIVIWGRAEILYVRILQPIDQIPAHAHAARLDETRERSDSSVVSSDQAALSKATPSLELAHCAQGLAVNAAVDSQETVAPSILDDLYVEQPLHRPDVIVAVTGALLRISD